MVPALSLTIVNVMISKLFVAVGAEPPDHLTPPETEEPLTLQASP